MRAMSHYIEALVCQLRSMWSLFSTFIDLPPFALRCFLPAFFFLCCASVILLFSLPPSHLSRLLLPACFLFFYFSCFWCSVLLCCRLRVSMFFSPQNVAPRIIGKGGIFINRLMQDSRAKIVVKPYTDKSGNDIVMTGTPGAVKVSLACSTTGTNINIARYVPFIPTEIPFM